MLQQRHMRVLASIPPMPPKTKAMPLIDSGEPCSARERMRVPTIVTATNKIKTAYRKIFSIIFSALLLFLFCPTDISVSVFRNCHNKTLER